jgi:hypothetical protein
MANHIYNRKKYSRESKLTNKMSNLKAFCSHSQRSLLRKGFGLGNKLRSGLGQKKRTGCILNPVNWLKIINVNKFLKRR